MFFTPRFFTFFQQLEKNNNKPWFDAHRDDYETHVKAPFRAFVTKIIEELVAQGEAVNTNPSKAIFRINRDIRFSKDKSPYKNNVGAIFAKGGTTDNGVGYYMHLGAKEIFVGGGWYQPGKEELIKIRQEIYYNNADFSALVNNKTFRSTFGTVQGETNKMIPSEYKDFLVEQPLIANKQFYYMKALTKEDVLSRNFDKTVLKIFSAGRPLNQFLAGAIA
ncbi:MAG: DUF2461 domain-containing protein [Chitinophagales bacterium]